MVKKHSINKLFWLSCALAIGIFFLDQGTKMLLQSIDTVLIPSVLHIHSTCNSGAVFGILKGSATILSWISVIAIGAIIFFSDKIKTKGEAVAVGLILGGILGNLVDRIIYKCVIDFIDVPFYANFNLADSSVTIGVALLILLEVLQETKKLKK